MVVRHKLHDHNETDPKKLKILRRKIFEDGKPSGVAWSMGDDREESVIECGSTITALETEFTIQEFTLFCAILRAWHKTEKRFGGRECVMVFPIPNMSHKRYYAPGSDQPMAYYPLDKIDPHYHVPRTQFEEMKSEPLSSVPCEFLTNGIRWSNTLGHPVGESFQWGGGDVLWDRKILLWLFNYRLRDEQFQRLWNYSLNTYNLGMGRCSIPCLEIDRQDAAFFLAVQMARNRRNHHA